MKQRWLIVDCNFLCWRSHYAFGGESLETNDGQKTSVAFGFLSELLRIQETLKAPHVVFCWDIGTSVRASLLPEYKANRRKPPKNATSEEIKQAEIQYASFQLQVKTLRDCILSEMGYKNIWKAKGYEADDWCAVAAQRLGQAKNTLSWIITADHDLYQCISPRVMFWNPAKKTETVTNDSFTAKYGIPAKWWAEVKAIAGCSGDNVPGISGVGEKSALQFLRGTINKNSKRYRDITSEEGRAIIARNRKLVTLPWPDTPRLPIARRLPDPEQWKAAVNNLNMDTLKDTGPYMKPVVRKKRTKT